MKLLGRNKGDGDGEGFEEISDADESVSGEPDAAAGSKQTAPKGRPTPKRDANVRKGPVAPAPMTSSEARARRKELAGPKLSRAERKVARAERRARMDETRQRQAAGDQAVLPARDKGPVRAYVRDIVDSRRNLLGAFLPAGILIMFMTFSLPLQLQQYSSLAMFALLGLMAVDALLLSRTVRNKVDAKFPDNAESSWKLGTYSVGRASQLRRMRVPRPRVERGEKID